MFFHLIDLMVMVKMVYGQMLLKILDEHQYQDVHCTLMDEKFEAKKRRTLPNH
jgi:hypothetical protein